jgi:predicted nucleic acid-binding Zn ribbon protein
MRNKNNVTLKQALDSMVKDLRLKSGIDEIRVQEEWHKIMGAPISKYTKEISLKKGKLYVKVESAPLKQELSYSRDKIKELFNKELGEEIIREVIIF